MEDVRLARKTTSETKAVATAATSAIAIPQENRRYSLIISNNGANPVYLSFQSPATAANGILMPINSPPLVLDLQHHGRVVCTAIYAISPAGASAIAYAETVLEDE